MGTGHYIKLTGVRLLILQVGFTEILCLLGTLEEASTTHWGGKSLSFMQSIAKTWTRNIDTLVKQKDV